MPALRVGVVIQYQVEHTTKLLTRVEHSRTHDQTLNSGRTHDPTLFSGRTHDQTLGARIQGHFGSPRFHLSACFEERGIAQ